MNRTNITSNFTTENADWHRR